jgi:hypothetical protein
MKKEIQRLTRELENEQEQCQFYHRSALDSKRQKKLLKVALNRLEAECDTLREKYQIAEQDLQFA